MGVAVGFTVTVILGLKLEKPDHVQLGELYSISGVWAVFATSDININWMVDKEMIKNPRIEEIIIGNFCGFLM